MEVVEVRCFGVPDSKVRDVGAVRPLRSMRDGQNQLRKTVTIYNDKIKYWETCELVDYHDRCPVCDRMMHVMAVQGTTWIACCSRPCYTRWFLADQWKQKGCPICGASLKYLNVQPSMMTNESRKHIYDHSDKEFAIYKLLGTNLTDQGDQK